MAKAKFNFKKLEKEIKYLAMYCGYCDENGNFPDFEEEEEDGSVSIDNVPWTIGEFEKKGYKYGGSWYHVSSEFGTEDSELQFHYCFYPDCNCITIEGETFSMKECMIVINMVMRQLEDNKHSYCISYGFEKDESFQSFHHDASHFALWWNHFIRFFEGRIDDIKKISIQIEEFEEDGKIQPVVVIAFDDESTEKEEKSDDMKTVEQYIKDDGESYVTLNKDGVDTEHKVCDLVWESFNKRKIPEGFVVIHIDGNKQNNRLDNLKLEKA